MRVHNTEHCLNREMRFSSFNSLEKDTFSYQNTGCEPHILLCRAIATALFSD